MLKKILLLVIFLPLLFTSTAQVKADPAVSDPTQNMNVVAKQLDNRANILKDYLVRYNSPLQNNAQDFIDAANAYGVDWKLVPSIAGVESTFGQNTPGGFNSWGWGVYGNQAIYFNSQKEAIFTVTKGLKENYIDKGLSDPYQINYTYAASPYWGGRVNYFMADLDRFAQNYQVKTVKAKITNFDLQTQSPSAQLNLKTGPLFTQELTAGI